MTLFQYLKQELEAGGNIDHLLRVKFNAIEACFEFYIHPHGTNGNTADFILWEDPISRFDILMPQDAVRPCDPEKFRRFMQVNRITTNLLDYVKHLKKDEVAQ